MDYAHASYYPPPVQQYPYFDIPPPNEHSYPPHEGRITNPIVGPRGLEKARTLLAEPD